MLIKFCFTNRKELPKSQPAKKKVDSNMKGISSADMFGSKEKNDYEVFV